jgi:lipopolysaccharide export system protein LptA
MRRRLLRTVASMFALGTAMPSDLTAQGSGCDIELRPAADSLRVTTTTSMPNGPRTIFAGGRVEARCLNQDVRLLADSAEWYQQAQVLYLIGNVRYTEPRARVTADLMNYFQADERLVATGNVVATLPSGSVMRGPEATYLRAIPRMRTARLVAVQRPRLTLVQRDNSGKASEPVLVTANQIVTENDSLVFAGGKVEITRSDLDTRSDSAFLDGGNELARLMIKPVIIGKGEGGYTLRGRQVELYTRNRIVQRVLAQAEARATSDDLLLTSDTIDLRVNDNRAQAAYVWGPSRARAISPDRDLIADSLAVRMPNQSLREVRAFGNAVATTIPDTATIRSGDKDWLKGDTILAYFDSTRTRPARATSAAADTAERPTLQELLATGHASARYQIPVQGQLSTRPAINYSRGDRITVTMDSTGVSRVQIDENAVGLYLEPVIDSVSLARPDSAASTTPSDTPRPPPAGTTAPGTIPPAPKPLTAPRPAAKPAGVDSRFLPGRQ